MNTKNISNLYSKKLIQANFSKLLTINGITTDDLNEHYNIYINSLNNLTDILLLIKDSITSAEHVKISSNKALNTEQCFSLYGVDWTEIGKSAHNYFNVNC